LTNTTYRQFQAQKHATSTVCAEYKPSFHSKNPEMTPIPKESSGIAAHECTSIARKNVNMKIPSQRKILTRNFKLPPREDSK
jgi:hypothetical protein